MPENPLGAQPEEFLEFFALLGNHRRLGLNLDVGHANVTGNLREFLRMLRDKWRYSHLHDNRGQTDEHLAPGMRERPRASFP